MLAGIPSAAGRVVYSTIAWSIEASEDAMKTATASRMAVGTLTLFAWAAVAGGAEAQGKAERAPEPVAPNLKRRPEPLPPLRRPEGQAPRDEMPSADDETPPQGRGCPDHGRKLELIV